MFQVITGLLFIMTTTKLTRSQQKHLDIVAAATTLFIAHGFTGTSVDQIAENANVSKRTLYKHFPNKEALFKHITYDITDRIEAQMFKPYDPSKSFKLQLRQLTIDKVASLFTTDNRALIRMLSAEIHNVPGFADNLYQYFLNEDHKFANWLKTAAKKGNFKIKTPKLASRLYWAQIRGAFFWPYLAISSQPTQTEITHSINIATNIFITQFTDLPKS